MRKGGREGERESSFKTIALLMAIPIAGIAILFLWSFFRGGLVAPRTPSVAAAASAAEGRVVRAAGKGPAAEAAAATRHRGDIVLIIDDVGFDGQPIDRLSRLDPNLNFSVLPNGSRAGDFAARLHARGFELLCHLPMEPLGHESPGAGAITTSMSDEEIARRTIANVQAVPFARGVNNHMGSRATTDRRVMNEVIQALPKGMYFIDSRTVSGSIAEAVAREHHVRTAGRNVFLDDTASEPAVRRELARLAAAAETRGLAIGIGHPYPVTVKVLEAEVPELRARGFRFVRASEAVR